MTFPSQFPVTFFAMSALMGETETVTFFPVTFFLLAHCYFLSCYSIHTATQKNCYFLSCYFFPTCPLLLSFLLLYSYCYPKELLLSFLLLFFLLAHCYFLSCYFFSYLSTVTFFPVTFFPVTFFPTWNCYFLSCYLFSCYFLSVHHAGNGGRRGLGHVAIVHKAAPQTPDNSTRTMDQQRIPSQGSTGPTVFSCGSNLSW